jgi:hypothetical protein
MTPTHALRRHRFSLFITLAICASTSQAQQRRGSGDFEWAKRLASGSTIAIRNAQGFIHVSASSSELVEIRAVKTRRSSSARDVAFDVDETNGRTTICTLSDGQRSCRERSGSSRGTYVRVDFTVYVPRDVRIDVATGNGEISVDRAGQSVSAATGNGRVFVATARGPVTVSTGNGDVDVRVASLPSGDDVAVTSGSGLIRVAVPADFGGQLDAQSGNGSLNSDFEITIFGRLEPQHIRGTIGRGSSRIKLLTGNGRIELRKY